MKPFPLTCKIVLINLFFFQSCNAKFSFDSIKSYFFKKSHQNSIQKEFPIKSPKLLTLKNLHGNISITQWKQNSIQMKATQEANKKEELTTIDIETKISKKKIAIKTVQKEPTKNELFVHYELIIPEQVKINVATEYGNISIDHINAATKAKTKNGDIYITNNKGIVLAQTDTGSITINNSCGNIRATTGKGNITIDKSSKNIIAHATKGTIYTTCQKIPSLNTVKLSTQSGNIFLSLPNKIDAHLQAETKKGKLTCEHYITLKPQTVQLNKKTWAQVKKEVYGTFGTGNANIKLNVGSGNIKILKTKTV
ncbi:DUF4097 family beta strand repeat protein [bacterium]|nr:DUF4097 family beta strand repeat protein [bacterium]